MELTMNTVKFGIVMNERIEKFNQFVMSLNIEIISLGLFSGKMGICLYFYRQARLTKNKKYEDFAKKLFDSICNQVQVETISNLEKGLVGICYGIDYLIKEKFISKNAKDIIKSLDVKILKTNNISDLLDVKSNIEINRIKLIVNISKYFCMRLKANNLSSNEHYLLKNYIIKSINKVDDVILSDLFNEPVLFSLTDYFLPSYLLLLSSAFELNFYNYKLIRIFNDLTGRLKATYPLLQSNRLLLSAAMRSIEVQKSMVGWKEHILFLDQSVDLNTCFRDEFRNRNIYPNDGITGLYYLISRLDKHKNIDLNLIQEKIVLSEVWNECLSNEDTLITSIGLVTGLCGVILTYQEVSSRI
jgi:lantibiotic modifying enzyme